MRPTPSSRHRSGASPGGSPQAARRPRWRSAVPTSVSRSYAAGGGEPSGLAPNAGDEQVEPLVVDRVALAVALEQLLHRAVELRPALGLQRLAEDVGGAEVLDHLAPHRSAVRPLERAVVLLEAQLERVAEQLLRVALVAPL